MRACVRACVQVVSLAQLKRDNTVLCAIKTMELQVAEENPNNLRQEFERLYLHDHPNVVPVYGLRFHQHEFLKAGIWQLHLFMHFADRDSLAQVMMRHRAAGLLMPALMVIGIAAQVLEALRFLHTEQRIAHRDIKPPNIMLRSDGRVMLQDFGNSRFSDSTQPDTDFETFVGCAQV